MQDAHCEHAISSVKQQPAVAYLAAVRPRTDGGRRLLKEVDFSTSTKEDVRGLGAVAGSTAYAGLLVKLLPGSCYLRMDSACCSCTTPKPPQESSGCGMPLVSLLISSRRREQKGETEADVAAKKSDVRFAPRGRPHFSTLLGNFAFLSCKSMQTLVKFALDAQMFVTPQVSQLRGKRVFAHPCDSSIRLFGQRADNSKKVCRKSQFHE